MAEPTQFDLASAARVARVVWTVEDTGPRARALTFDSVQQANRKVFRVCTFSGAWSKSAAKSVTIRGQTATVSAINLFADVAAPPGVANCAIARDGTAWYLIAAECS